MTPIAKTKKKTQKAAKNEPTNAMDTETKYDSDSALESQGDSDSVMEEANEYPCDSEDEVFKYEKYDHESDQSAPHSDSDSTGINASDSDHTKSEPMKYEVSGRNMLMNDNQIKPQPNKMENADCNSTMDTTKGQVTESVSSDNDECDTTRPGKMNEHNTQNYSPIGTKQQTGTCNESNKNTKRINKGYQHNNARYTKFVNEDAVSRSNSTTRIIATDEYENKPYGETQNPHKVMAQRGEGMVEDNITKYTRVTIEFNPKREDQSFNVRQALMNLINAMWHVEPNIKIQSKITDETWGPSDALPTKQKFIDHYKVYTTTTKINTSKVHVHVTMITNEEITRLKWRPAVRDYIFNHNIWIREDKFEAQVSSTPGYFINIHPRGTNRDDFAEEIKYALSQVEVDTKKRIVQDWLNNETEPQSIPPFEVRLALRKWGQIQTEVLSIECAKVHAQYMKYLISTAVETNLLNGCLFVPIGIHLMKSSEVLANLLRQHNHMIANLTTFEVYGIYPQHDNTNTEETRNQSIINTIKSSPMIHKMERTSNTEDRGIWTIIVEKSNEGSTRSFLEKTND